jgi:nucleoside-diphosphate-sugar epimerase
VKAIRGGIHNSVDRSVLKKFTYDVIVQWIGFTPADVERDLETFQGRTGQYIFNSSASAYEKPPSHYLITESTPLVNPYWEYSRNKIACEGTLLRAQQEASFPVTLVRPSLTYGDTLIPLAINSWERSYTVVDRMRKGQQVIVPGDGSSLWVITHNSDFAKGLVGLLGNPRAIGESFHITTDEVMTWDQFYRLTAAAAGVVAPRLVRISSDFLAACLPDMIGSLIGDKSASVVFDNSKIRRVVPEYLAATTTYPQGIQQTLPGLMPIPPTGRSIRARMRHGTN